MPVETNVADERATSGLDGIPIRRITAPLVRRLQQICVAMVSEALADAGLVQLEYALLVFIEDVPGIHQRTLSQAMGIDRNNVSIIVDRLEAQGLVVRSPGAEDRRAWQLFLTPRGKALRRRLRPRIRTANERILSPLKPAERELFIDMLARLVQAHRVHARPGAGRRKRRSANQQSRNQRGHEQASKRNGGVP
jgi:DNA-binding MarR family transcriptional regulator